MNFTLAKSLDVLFVGPIDSNTMNIINNLGDNAIVISKSIPILKSSWKQRDWQKSDLIKQKVVVANFQSREECLMLKDDSDCLVYFPNYPLLSDFNYSFLDTKAPPTPQTTPLRRTLFAALSIKPSVPALIAESVKSALHNVWGVASDLKSTATEIWMHGQAVASLYNVKNSTELTIGASLNTLSPSIEAPIRQLIRHIPFFPLAIPNRNGKLSIVSVGPGDPNMISKRSLDILVKANVIIADESIPKHLIAYIKSITPYTHYPRSLKSPCETALDFLVEGRSVARIVSGDAMFFAPKNRIEVELLSQQGYSPVEISSGITPALAAATTAGITLSTDVSIIKGNNTVHIPTYKDDRTLVIMMPVGNMQVLVQRMLDLGYPLSTPVCLVEKATWGVARGERMTNTVLGEVFKIVFAKRCSGPAVLFVGNDIVAKNGVDMSSLTSASMSEF